MHIYTHIHTCMQDMKQRLSTLSDNELQAYILIYIYIYIYICIYIYIYIYRIYTHTFTLCMYTQDMKERLRTLSDNELQAYILMDIIQAPKCGSVFMRDSQVYICTYIHTCVCLCVCVCIFMYVINIYV